MEGQGPGDELKIRKELQSEKAAAGCTITYEGMVSR